MDQLTVSRHLERIRELDESWLAAFRRRDVAGMTAIYAIEAEELQPGEPPLAGHEAIREFYRRLFGKFPRCDHSFTTEEVMIAESADLAVARGSYRFTFDHTKPDEAEVGKFVGVWVFRAGDWRLQLNISNADGAPTR